MSGGNTTIGGTESTLATTVTSIASGDSMPAWSATGAITYQAFPSMIAAVTYSTTVALTNQTTATACATGAVSFFASSPAGFVTVSINGTPMKLPYYNT